MSVGGGPGLTVEPAKSAFRQKKDLGKPLQFSRVTAIFLKAFISEKLRKCWAVKSKIFKNLLFSAKIARNLRERLKNVRKQIIWGHYSQTVPKNCGTMPKTAIFMEKTPPQKMHSSRAQR